FVSSSPAAVFLSTPRVLGWNSSRGHPTSNLRFGKRIFWDLRLQTWLLADCALPVRCVFGRTPIPWPHGLPERAIREHGGGEGLGLRRGCAARRRIVRDDVGTLGRRAHGGVPSRGAPGAAGGVGARAGADRCAPCAGAGRGGDADGREIGARTGAGAADRDGGRPEPAGAAGRWGGER